MLRKWRLMSIHLDHSPPTSWPPRPNLAAPRVCPRTQWLSSHCDFVWLYRVTKTCNKSKSKMSKKWQRDGDLRKHTGEKLFSFLLNLNSPIFRSSWAEQQRRSASHTARRARPESLLDRHPDQDPAEALGPGSCSAACRGLAPRCWAPPWVTGTPPGTRSGNWNGDRSQSK